MKNRRLISIAVISIGFILSPLSWWNDLVVNVPLAYLFSFPFSLAHEALFLPTFVLGYWLSNLAGLLMLHWGGETLMRRKHAKLNLKHSLIVSLAYSAIIIFLVLVGWLSSPTIYLQQLS